MRILCAAVRCFRSIFCKIGSFLAKAAASAPYGRCCLACLLACWFVGWLRCRVCAVLACCDAAFSLFVFVCLFFLLLLLSLLCAASQHGDSTLFAAAWWCRSAVSL